MFKGTVRSNLDPFDEKSDPEMWEALDMVGLGGGRCGWPWAWWAGGGGGGDVGGSDMVGGGVGGEMWKALDIVVVGGEHGAWSGEGEGGIGLWTLKPYPPLLPYTSRST